MICRFHQFADSPSLSCLACKLDEERTTRERLSEAAMTDLVRLHKEVQHLRGVVWHAAELLECIHENPQYATSPVIMRTSINSVLDLAHNPDKELP